MVTRRRKRILSVREQLAWVRLRWPDLRSSVRGSKLFVSGDFQPTPLAEVYRVRIEYEVGTSPSVKVLKPVLKPRKPEGEIPHMYLQERLCLYMPWSGQWSGEKILADTIIPWTSLWLHYYELWHTTGEWLGGGHEPVPDEIPPREPIDGAYP